MADDAGGRLRPDMGLRKVQVRARNRPLKPKATQAKVAFEAKKQANYYWYYFKLFKSLSSILQVSFSKTTSIRTIDLVAIMPAS